MLLGRSRVSFPLVEVPHESISPACGSSYTCDVSSDALLRQHEFSVPDGFDYICSTHEAYQAIEGESGAWGPFAHIRSCLDQSYHGVYTRERQRLQDVLVENVVSVGRSQAHAWLIYTAGAMGAGKTRTVRWMGERGILPLHDFVHVDPDAFKTALPEWEGYWRRNPLSAGLNTQRESGYLAEIARETALRESKHVWVDGSLRDGAFHFRLLEDLRARYPTYRIALISVTAPEDVVMARVRSRAVVTGREVPVEQVRDSLARVPRSVELLAPWCDLFAEIENSNEEPFLVKYNCPMGRYLMADGWETLRQLFQTRPVCPSLSSLGDAAGVVLGCTVPVSRPWSRL